MKKWVEIIYIDIAMHECGVYFRFPPTQTFVIMKTLQMMHENTNHA